MLCYALIANWFTTIHAKISANPQTLTTRKIFFSFDIFGRGKLINHFWLNRKHICHCSNYQSTLRHGTVQYATTLILEASISQR